MRDDSWQQEDKEWRELMIDGAINAVLLICALAPVVFWLLSTVVCLVC
ncbi:MAG: hypothetical protein IPM60_15555 [Rhodospirillales bacterium]|nr:hypothetical protein [Rhodospirillales bacterium]